MRCAKAQAGAAWAAPGLPGRVVSTSQSESGANYTSLSDDSGMGSLAERGAAGVRSRRRGSWEALPACRAESSVPASLSQRHGVRAGPMQGEGGAEGKD